MIRNILFRFVLLLSLTGPRLAPPAASAATPTPTPAISAKVFVHLLDTNHQPQAGVTVNLVLNRYGDTIEEIPFGSCITDATGSCSIMVNDPPQLRSGRIEGFIDLGAFGRKLIGWKGERFEIALQLSPDRKLATVPAPLDGPYKGQTEQPTDAPLSTSTSASAATVTPVSTATTFHTTPAKTFPTETVTVAVTAMIPPQSVPTQTPASVSEPAPHQAKRPGWVWIGLGLALFAVLGITLMIHYHRQRKHKKSG